MVTSLEKKLSLTLFMLFKACCNLSGYSKYPWEALLKISSRSKSESLSRLHLSSNSIHGLLKDRDVLDEAGVRLLNVSQGSFTESFIKIQHLEACQDTTYPPSQSLESWRKGLFFMELEMVSCHSKYPREALLKVSSRSNIWKLVKTPPILQVLSWSLAGQGSSWWS